MAMKRTAIKGLAITFLMFLIAAATVCIILAGIVYRFANPDFVTNSFSAVSALLIASTIYAFFVGFLGFLVFLNPKTSLIILFEILLFVSILFTLAIAIYALVAGSISYPNVQIGCNAKITGILEVFSQMDTYLINVDRSLCSADCPCRLTNKSAFQQNPNTTAAFSTWAFTDQVFGATAFQNCSSAVQANALAATVTQNPLFPVDSFSPSSFADYMSRMEREFNCVGWCNVVYLTPASTTPITFSKYLFSNINRGIPQYVGCIQKMMSWLPGYLLAWGSVAMVLFGIELVLFALALMLSASRKSEGGHDVIHHERVEVVERQ